MLVDEGHNVRLLTKGEQPSWFPLKVKATKVHEFTKDVMPYSDLVIGVGADMALKAYEIGRGIPVHYCLGYEGDIYPHLKEQIDYIFNLDTVKLTNSAAVHDLIKNKFGINSYNFFKAVDTEIFFPSQMVDNRKRRILISGAYEIQWKGIKEALNAIALVKKQMDIEVVRISQMPMTKEERSSSLIDEYYCNIPLAKVAEIYRSCDIFVSSSHEQEGFGRPFLEAMATGIPGVITDISAYKQYKSLINNQYALFSKVGDYIGMAKNITTLLNDVRLYNRIRSNGLKLVKNFFSYSKVANELNDIIQDIYYEYKEHYEIPHIE